MTTADERTELAVSQIVSATTTAAQAAVGDVTAAYENDLAELQAEFDAYKAAHPDGGTDPEPPEPAPDDVTTIGMSAEAKLWDQRLASVGEDGVTARRIFCQLTSNGRDQEDLIREAYGAEMLPVVSYKVPNVQSAIKGSYDAWAGAAASFLSSFDRACVVAVWHEPHGDMTAAEFVKLQERLMPIFKVGKLIVGPILNGWLLDRRVNDFKAYMNANLLDNVWDFVAIDTYQPDNPDSDTIPGDRIDPLIELLDSMGYPDMRIGVGEYNGFDADSIARSGEKFLHEPRVRFAMMWNSANASDLGHTPLEGERLEAFQATKADERARQGWAI